MAKLAWAKVANKRKNTFRDTQRSVRKLSNRFELNGVRMAYGADVIDEVISAGEVEGIEVYHGTSAPIQYVGITTCGVVMLWSRDPVSRGRPFTWGRLLFTVGFGVLFVFGPTAR